MPDDKLKQLLAQREAVNARIRRELNKKKDTDRRNDTRRKVLVGAAVLEWATRDQDFSARLMNELGSFLVRDADRALFGLSAKEQGKG